MISWRKHYKKGLIAISLLLSTGASVYAQGDPKKGQDLFKTNCTACHALDKQVIGPALGGVVDRLKKEQNLDTDWLHKWIKDNRALRASGDKYANEVFSIGEYILTGGELPSLVMADAISRNVQGVLGNEASLDVESYENNLLEAPSFTKPSALSASCSIR